MDITELEKLVKLMNDNDLVELEIEEEGSSVRLRKAPAVAAYPPVPAAYLQGGPPPASGAAPAPAPVPSGPPPGTVEIRSPIVGTFYKSPSPESPPFVGPGDRVKPDSVVCIIEAMKVMNEIKAEVSGRITRIAVEDATPVSYGQVLFEVKP